MTARKPLTGKFEDFDDDPVIARSRTSRKGDLKLIKGKAKKADSLLEETFREGEKEGRYQERRKSSARQARLKARRRKYPRARKVAGKVRQPVSTGTARGIRQAQAPVAAQVASATKLAVTSMTVVGLYLFLENATAVQGALGSLSRGLEWFKAPNSSIPYVKQG